MSISTRWSQIFWGLVLVFLDLRINGFDLLPDFVGYILVAIGCAGLTRLSEAFATASMLGWILTAFWFADFVVPHEIAFVFSLIDSGVDCAMMWFLLGGINEFTSARRRPDLSARALNCRIAYVSLICLANLAVIVAEHAHDLATGIAVFSAVCVVVLAVLILCLIHRVKRELSGEDASSAQPANEPPLDGRSGDSREA